MDAPWAFYEKIFWKLNERGRVLDPVVQLRQRIGNFGKFSFETMIQIFGAEMDENVAKQTKTERQRESPGPVD